jgi:hypothetical protein
MPPRNIEYYQTINKTIKLILKLIYNSTNGRFKLKVTVNELRIKNEVLIMAYMNLPYIILLWFYFSVHISKPPLVITANQLFLTSPIHGY